jgi:hypothetical protein
MPIQIKVKTNLGDTTVTILNNAQSQDFQFDIIGNPKTIVFDSGNWILNDINGRPGTEILPIPSEYKLDQNFPNPFNPSTTIKYQIPENSFVTLNVYDVLGNLITTLVNNELPAGSYEVEYNSVGLSSGIYFYRLQVYPANGGAGSFVETKKMVLLK